MLNLSQADLYAVLRKLFPDYWVAGLESGVGQGLLQGYCAAGERLSLAIKHFYDHMSAGTAPFGEVSTGTVSIARSGDDAGTLYAGSELVDLDGWKFITLEDAAFAINDQTPVVVDVVSINKSFQTNLRPGTILGVSLPVPTPLWDTTVIGTVVSLTGGIPSSLEARTEDKGLSVIPGETDTEVRERIRTLADNITPNAIKRVLAATFPTAVLREGWQQAGPSTDVDFYTDYRGATWPDEGTTLEYGHYQAWFTVEVPALVIPLQDMTWMWADYAHTDYQDGYASQQLIGVTDDGTQYDMGNNGTRTDLGRMVQQVEAARAGGVRWQVVEVV